jgi:hypothetical protein
MPNTSTDGGINDPFLLAVACMRYAVDNCVLTFEGSY